MTQKRDWFSQDSGSVNVNLWPVLYVIKKPTCLNQRHPRFSLAPTTVLLLPTNEARRNASALGDNSSFYLPLSITVINRVLVPISYNWHKNSLRILLQISSECAQMQLLTFQFLGLDGELLIQLDQHSTRLLSNARPWLSPQGTKNRI